MRLPLYVCLVAALAVCFSTAAVTSAQKPPAQDNSIPSLQKKLRSDLPRDRQIAAESLGNLGPKAKEAIPDLMVLLQSQDPADVMAGAMALGRMGPEARVALPALEKLASSPDPNVSKVAKLAMDTIDPPVATRAKDVLLSPYGITAALVVVAGIAALVVLKKRSEAAAPAATSAAAGAPAAAPKPAAAPARAVAASAPVPTATPAAESPANRRRVSKQLPGLQNYVTEHVGPESVKRELGRAQDDLKKLTDRQQALARQVDEAKGDTARLKGLLREADTFARQHYTLEVRVKAFEVKMLETLLAEGAKTDDALRERSEVLLKQRWEELRTLCENPVKVTWQGSGWSRVSTGPTRQIEDIRSFLKEFDVSMPERPPRDAAQDEPPEPVYEVETATEAAPELALEAPPEPAPEPAAETPEPTREPAAEAVPAAEAAPAEKPEAESSSV